MTVFFKYLLMSVSYYLAVITISITYFTVLESKSISESILLFNDSIHYLNISNQGYANHFEVAFFPLFPYIWKLFGFSLVGVSGFNGILYTLCISLLAKIEQFSLLNFAIALALPSAIFFFLPYSESLYFACSCAILYSLKKNIYVLEAISILLCCFCRPVLPIVLASLIFFHFYRKDQVYRTVLSCSIALIGTFLAFLVHRFYTGNLFSYFSAFNTWDYNFKFPLLPFTSGGGTTIVQLDGYALLFGLFAIITLVRLFKNNFTSLKSTIAPANLFSLLYIAFFTLLILSLMRGGNLTSMNRFIFCSPFFILALYFLENNFVFSKETKSVLILFATLILYSFLFRSYVHIQPFMKYAFGAMIITLYLSKSNVIEKRINFEKSILLGALVFLQFIVFNKFLHGEWIG
jgi:hypothetical protein